MEKSLEIIEAIAPSQYAKEAGLRYVSDDMPGFTRQKVEEGYAYLNQKGESITDEVTLARIRSLSVPHIWENVWICPLRHGHLQATGTDLKGRKQYRYHAEWQKVRSSAKFHKMQALGEALSRIREELQRDLQKPVFSRQYVLATVTSVLDTTHIRIGNSSYEKTNHSYGLTTLRNRHVREVGNALQIGFVGKKGVYQEVLITDRKMVRLIRKCKELPGHRLFQFYDEQGNKHPVSSEDVNGYLREISGLDLTAKDFRTWGGSVEALRALSVTPPTDQESEKKKHVVEAIKSVANALGNTPTVCRSYYIHPMVIRLYLEGKLLGFVAQNQYVERVENELLSDEEKLFIKLLNDPPA